MQNNREKQKQIQLNIDFCQYVMYLQKSTA